MGLQNSVLRSQRYWHSSLIPLTHDDGLFQARISKYVTSEKSKTDVQSALVGFTEDQAKPSTRQPSRHLEQIQANVKNITILLNTWSGMATSFATGDCDRTLTL